MDLLKDMRESLGLSYLFITHDLTAITYFCDRVRFMHNGRFVEAVDDMREIGAIRSSYARDLLNSVMGIGVNRRDSLDGALSRAAADEEAYAAHGAGPHAPVPPPLY